jgi:hypothetical protein
MGPFRNGKGVVAACSISGTHAPQCSLSPCRVSRHATNAIPRLLNTRELMEKRLMVANMGGGVHRRWGCMCRCSSHEMVVLIPSHDGDHHQA